MAVRIGLEIEFRCVFGIQQAAAGAGGDYFFSPIGFGVGVPFGLGFLSGVVGFGAVFTGFDGFVDAAVGGEAGVVGRVVGVVEAAPGSVHADAAVFGGEVGHEAGAFPCGFGIAVAIVEIVFGLVAAGDVDVFRAGAEVAFDRAAGSHDFIALCPEHDDSFLVLRVEKGRISGGKTRRRFSYAKSFLRIIISE